MPIQSSSHVTQAFEAIMEYFGFKGVKRLTDEKVTAVRADGTAQLANGAVVRTSGNYRGLQAGQVIPVLHSRGQGVTSNVGAGGAGYAMVLSHQIRQGIGGRRLGVSAEPVVGVVEELWSFAAPGDPVLGTPPSVWFRNALVFAKLLGPTDIPLDAPLTSQGQLDAVWGFGDRMFYLRIRPDVFDPRFDYYLIYALDRPEGGPSTGAPSARFIRRVNRPVDLVISSVVGLTFNQIQWSDYLGQHTDPAQAAFVWSSKNAYLHQFSPISNVVTIRGWAAVVADVGGTASLVVERELVPPVQIINVVAAPGGGQAAGSQNATMSGGAEIAYWSQDVQRIVWRRHDQITVVTGAVLHPNFGFWMTTSLQLTSSAQIVITEGGQTLLEESRTASEGVATESGETLSVQSFAEVVTGQGDSLHYEFNRVIDRIFSDHSNMTVTFEPFLLLFNPLVKIPAPYPAAPLPGVAGGSIYPPMMTTHFTAAVPVEPINASDPQWAIIDVRNVPGTGPVQPLAEQIQIGALVPPPMALPPYGASSRHVVYDLTALARAGLIF